MKLNRKNILACALGAGLMTLGMGVSQAIGVGNEIVAPLNVQLSALTTTSRGKVQKIRITAKDLLVSTGFTAKGESIVILSDEEDVWVMDKQGELIEDLTADGILEISFDEFDEDDTSTQGGGFRESSVGTVEVSFFSDGSDDAADSDLTFDLDGTFTFVLTGTAVPGLHGLHAKIPTNRLLETLNVNLSNLGTEGFDFDINESDDVPVSGSMTATGSGLVNPI